MDCISEFSNETILFNYLKQMLKQFQGSTQYLQKKLAIYPSRDFILLYIVNTRQHLWRSILSLCCLGFHIVSLHLTHSVYNTKRKMLPINSWQWKCLSWFSKAIKRDLKTASSCQVSSAALEEKLRKGDRHNMTWWYTAQKIWKKKNQTSYQCWNFWNSSEWKRAVKQW